MEIIEEYLTKETMDLIYFVKVKVYSIIWHYDYLTREIINKLDKNDKKTFLTEKLNLLKIENEKEMLCRLYFFVEIDLKTSPKIKNIENEINNYLKQLLTLKDISNDNRYNSTACIESFETMTENIIALYQTEKIIYNYFDHIIKNYSYVQNIFCSMKPKIIYSPKSFEIKEKDRLYFLLDVEDFKKLELKYPEILKIHHLQTDVGISYYQDYLTSDKNSDEHYAPIDKLDAIFLLNEIYKMFEKIKKFEAKSKYLYEMLKIKIEWAINEVYSKIEKFSTEGNLCFMFEFLKIINSCLSNEIKTENMMAIIISIWKGTYCERALTQLKNQFFFQKHVDQINLYKLYKRCTEPGMLTRLDFLSNNKSLEKYLEIDIESDNQRERLRKHFIKALFGESKIAIIRNRNAVQIISFIRWINKTVSDVKKNAKKSGVNKEFLEYFERQEMLEYKISYDRIFDVESEIVLEEQKSLFENQIKLSKGFFKYKKNLKIDDLLLIDILSEYVKEFKQNSNEIKIDDIIKQKFIKWRQSLVADELFNEINTKKDKENKKSKGNKKSHKEEFNPFRDELIKGLKASLYSRQRLFGLIGHNTKLFDLLGIKFIDSEFKNIDKPIKEEEYNAELGYEHDETLTDTMNMGLSKTEKDMGECSNEILEDSHLIKNPSTSGSKANLSKRKRNQLKMKSSITNQIEDNSKNDANICETKEKSEDFNTETVYCVEEVENDMKTLSISTKGDESLKITDDFLQDSPTPEGLQTSSSESAYTEESSNTEDLNISSNNEAAKLAVAKAISKAEKKRIKNFKRNNKIKAKQDKEKDQEHLDAKDDADLIEKGTDSFDANTELIQLLKVKGYWESHRKAAAVGRDKSLDEAKDEVEKIIKAWDKQAITVISGSYLLNIESIESDVDFIVILPFYYDKINSHKFITKNMLDHQFLGIPSQWNSLNKKECSNDEKGSLYWKLFEYKETSWLRRITTGVAELNAKIHGYSFDLAFVAYPWEGNSQQVEDFIDNEKDLKSIDKVDDFIFNFTEKFGYDLKFDRVGMLNALSAHFIYNGKLGFFSGTSLTILVTHLLIANHSKDTYQLLSKFFVLYSRNYHKKRENGQKNPAEPEPIILPENSNNYLEAREAIDWNIEKELKDRKKLYINNKEEELKEQILEKQKLLEEAICRNETFQKIFLEKEIFEKQALLEEAILNKELILEKNKKMEKHSKLVWPIITPGFPKQNAGFNINMSTRSIMWREMKKAHSFLTTNIKEALKSKSKMSKNDYHQYLRTQWDKLLLQGEDFSKKYNHYLAIVCTYSPESKIGEAFCDFSTTRIRLELLFSIETEIGAFCHANLDKKKCPKDFIKKGWLCMIWLVGIDYEKDLNDTDQNDIKQKFDKLNADFKQNILEAYKPRGLNNTKMSAEERNVIMIKIGYDVKYYKKEELRLLFLQNF
uniref:PAP_central domain-containing protein n=1 Tax=Meloidogyne hapla TaxID=6305 RepID=A0A1I8BT71_MELHA